MNFKNELCLIIQYKGRLVLNKQAYFILNELLSKFSFIFFFVYIL